MHRSIFRLLKHDFDAWGYNIYWPQRREELSFFGALSLAAEDIKFAYNAWCFLRLAMFYNTPHPKVLSSLVNCTPSMDIAHGGNRLFYMHSEVKASLSPTKKRVALTPCHPHAKMLQTFPWREVVGKTDSGCLYGEDDNDGGVEIVLGMENGLSERVIAQCDYCLYIPQYGSIGSLSMLSAMAIAVHAAFSTLHVGVMDVDRSFMVPSQGHMPLSNDQAGTVPEKLLPHEKNLIHLSNHEIAGILAERRLSYRLQLSVMVYNELGDRNIGAIMRNANAFNCEQMIVLHRRKFNRRGAVGTQHLLRTTFHSTIKDESCLPHLEGYAIWLLYQYYPYLRIHHEDESVDDADVTFIRPENSLLQEWLQTDHRMSEEHPIATNGGAHLVGTEVHLDDFSSLRFALQSVMVEGFRGVMLVIPEEGVSPHPDIIQSAQRIAYIVHPERLANKVQRGLNGALSSAIALERLRTAIDSL